MPSSVLIAGGGASGALLAAALVRESADVAVTVIEPRERLGAGMAYSTNCPLHVLNVPAAKMSAFATEPNHFVEWLAAAGYDRYDARSFVPRPLYGTYLASIAAHAREQHADRFRHVRDVVVDAAIEASGIAATCESGTVLRGDVLVLALGNAAPAAWPSISPEVHASRRFFESAWDPAALVPADPDETALLLGTGLTAVDAVLGLRHNGHRGTIHMVSRRGLLPHEHRLFDAPPSAAPDAKTVRDLLVNVRASARDAKTTFDNWRIAIDGVRPKTNALWQALTLADQRRFVRHVMPYWNVHRHRMAPEAAVMLADLIATDTLRMLTGRTEEIMPLESALRVPIRLRGSAETIVIHAGRVINCSGPEHDFRKLPNPLVRRLLDAGSIVPYPLEIGLQVAPNGALIDAAGAVSSRLFAIGPVRYGTLIETTAIPEIRVQAQELAELLAAGSRRPMCYTNRAKYAG